MFQMTGNSSPLFGVGNMGKATFIYLLSILLFVLLSVQQLIDQREIKAELRRVNKEIELLRQEQEHSTVVYDDMIQMILKGVKGDW